MAINRPALGFTVLRILIGVFFVFEGLGKLSWFVNSSILAGRFQEWLQTTSPGSLSHRYLETIAVPYTWLFARLVPAGELGCGIALIAGFYTPIVAAIAFFMVMNIHLASGALFRYSFLTNGYGLPVAGSTLALAIGGARLPWSVRG
jgi:uncharacterized membrane protein YphA (DoxX/SURF4 family)